NIKAPENYEYRPSYKVLNHSELISYIQSKENLKNTGCVITEIGDKFMLIKWERFRKNSF
ncbi:MAG TPA: hypothetical protein PLH86_12100, partial [Saprospiraceae bacterium]|nr:hypothetical protein [Saprospiraceae bacterium]